MRKHSRAFTACISTAALVGFGAAAMAPMASAAPAGGSFAAASVADVLVDETATTTLTIHKYLGAPVGGPSDGTELTEAPALPTLEGVEFDVYQVFYDAALTNEVDLTTNQGWADAAAVSGYVLNQADIAAGSFTVGAVTYYLGTPAEVVTDANGEAVLTGNNVGLYLVDESIETGDVITDGATVVEASSITPAAPFFVTLPMTHPTNLDAWMYDVHAYPKNTSDSITKAVADQGTVTDDHGNAVAGNLVYTLTSTITAGLTGEQMGTYVVGDDLDDRLQPVALTVAVGTTTLVAGTDYTVYVNDVATTDTADLWAAGAKFEVVMTAAGLDALAAAKDADPGATVTTTMEVNADSMYAAGLTDGDIRNQSALVPNAAWWAAQTGSDTPFDPTTDDPTDVPDPIDSNVVQSLYGALDITKVAAQDNNLLLAGATFSVYRDANDDGACEDGQFGELLFSDLVTDANGALTVSGLQASNFYDGAVQTVEQTYCLVETQSPDGYNLLADAVGFSIDAVDADADGFFDAATPAEMTLENALSNLGNDLPLTGGAGAAGLGLGALLLLGGAGAYAMKRRQDTNESVTVQG